MKEKQEDNQLKPDSPFGMGIYFGNRYSDEEMVKAAEMAQAIGIKWSREEMSWNYIDSQPGQWRFDRYDTAVDVAYSHGISLFGLLDYCVEWASPAPPDAENRWCWMPEINAWKNYVHHVVDRYKDKIKHWQVWNEPNISGFWQPEPNFVDYTELLKASFEIIKNIDAEAKILGCNTSRCDQNFIEGVFKEGGFECMDILGVHPYRYPRTPEETNFIGDMRELVTLMEKYGEAKPIWITEIGWPTHVGDERASTEEKQAAMIVRLYIQAIVSGRVEKIFWYNYRNDGLDKKYNEHNFGILHRDFTPKPAYIAYNTMTKAIGQAKYMRELDLGENVRAYLFAENEKQILVLWCLKGTQEAELEATGDVEVIDVMGKSSMLEAMRGVVKVKISGNPKFVKL